MKELLLNYFVSNAKESTTFSMNTEPDFKTHDRLATRSTASVSLWEPLCSTPLFSANSVFVYFTENDSPVSYVTKVGLT